MDMAFSQEVVVYEKHLFSEASLKDTDEFPSTSNRDDGASDVAPDSNVFSRNLKESAEETALSFDQLNNSKGSEDIDDVTCIPEAVVHGMKRVQILDEKVDESNDSQWAEWPERFIEMNGFRLGIDPGDFYKHETMPYFYVKLPHRSKYEVVVTNNNLVPCDLDLYINGVKTNEQRLLAGVSHSIDSPYDSHFAFTCFRSQNAPSRSFVKNRDRNNGLVKAVFTPEKKQHARGRTVSEPAYTDTSLQSLLDMLDNTRGERKTRSYTTSDQGKVSRSLDMKGVVEGVTLLQGRKKTRYYVAAPEMEVDVSKRVTLQLRLIASATEEVEGDDEEAYACEPPSIS